MAMRAGRALRDRARDAERATKPCPAACGHLEMQHLELPPETPGYAPLRFHCRGDGCDCVISPTRSDSARRI